MKTKKNKTKEELELEIKMLEKEKAKLELENDVLKKANEILKKEVGIDYSLLSNKEKTLIVNALKETYKIKELLKAINLKKSTYFYEAKVLNIDKYEHIKRKIKEILKLMKIEKLIFFIPKSKKKYSSYKDEISPEVENIVNRHFIVGEPYKQALTDITEFALKDGKVYLSPLIDCFDGIPINWAIGKSPSSELTNSMLKDAHLIVGDRNLSIHSDRGFHYRLESWI